MRIALQISDGIFDGMKTMTHRTTFALDQEAAQRLRRLSEAWQVSQAEVVRRALAIAESAEPKTLNAGTILRKLHESGNGLEHDLAVRYLSDVQQGRREWRDDR